MSAPVEGGGQSSDARLFICVIEVDCSGSGERGSEGLANVKGNTVGIGRK